MKCMNNLRKLYIFIEFLLELNCADFMSRIHTTTGLQGRIISK